MNRPLLPVKDGVKNIGEEFLSIWPKLVEKILELSGSEDIELHRRLIVLLQSTVPQGKQNRGLALLHSYTHFRINPSPEEKFRAMVLGWCLEIVSCI
jgi:hypothetical protein